MIWLILGFFLQAWTCLLFFALFEYKPAWVQHEGPSLVILFYIGHRSAYSIRWIRPTQQCAHKVCTKCAQSAHRFVPDVSEELWQKCAYSKITVTRLPLDPTFALSAAIQSRIGENVSKFCKRRLGDEMQRRSVALWWIVWADIVSDLFVITRN